VVCVGTMAARAGPFIIEIFEGSDDGAQLDAESNEMIAPKKLGYGQARNEARLHVMQTSSGHYVENLTGFAAPAWALCSPTLIGIVGDGGCKLSRAGNSAKNSNHTQTGPKSPSCSSRHTKGMPKRGHTCIGSYGQNQAL
jgi:hypothetical protein